jgi:hypothetical protein
MDGDSLVSVAGVIVYSTDVFYSAASHICLCIARMYPDHAASLFVANECFKSIEAAGTFHSAQPLYGGLSDAYGVSALAALSRLGIGGMLFICFHGRKVVRGEGELNGMTHLRQNPSN